MDRRAFLAGLAATTALAPIPTFALPAVADGPTFIGWDFGAMPSDTVATMLQLLDDGRLAVRHITGIEFFKGPND